MASILQAYLTDMPTNMLTEIVDRDPVGRLDNLSSFVNVKQALEKAMA
jgi:hypothetical protein